MYGSDYDRFIRALKELVDDQVNGSYETNGPMRISLDQYRDSKGKTRYSLTVEAGWDNNYGGRVKIDCSPTGKSLTVHTSPEVGVSADG